MRTAHQNAPVPQNDREVVNKEFVDSSLSSLVASYDVLYQWNHLNVGEFTLTQPLSDGWAAVFVAATTTKAEHIRVTSANTGSASEAYLMVTANVGEADYEAWAVHNFFNTSNQQFLHLISRGDNVAGDVYAGARWEQPAGSLVAVYNEGIGDQEVASSLEIVPAGTSPEDYLVETHSSVRGHLIGKGWGRLSNYGHIDTSSLAGLGTSQ